MHKKNCLSDKKGGNSYSRYSYEMRNIYSVERFVTHCREKKETKLCGRTCH